MGITITVCDWCEATYAETEDLDRGRYWCATGAVAPWSALAKCELCGRTQDGGYPLLVGEPYLADPFN